MVVDETGAAVVAALDDVKGVTEEHDARGTRHAAIDGIPSPLCRHRKDAHRIAFLGV